MRIMTLEEYYYQALINKSRQPEPYCLCSQIYDDCWVYALITKIQTLALKIVAQASKFEDRPSCDAQSNKLSHSLVRKTPADSALITLSDIANIWALL